MAEEVRITAVLCYDDADSPEVSLAVLDLLKSVAATGYTRNTQSIGTTEEAIDLGDVTAPGWAIFINRDATNIIYLKTGTGGSRFAELKPGGEPALLRLGPDAQAPYAIALVAACKMEYLLIKT